MFVTRVFYLYKKKKPLQLLIFSLQTIHIFAGTQFNSHVSVNTPARSFSHGVGDPVGIQRRHDYGRSFRKSRGPVVPRLMQYGYAESKPSRPFRDEDVSHDNSLNVLPWQYEETIPLLPPSPYKVDSPDPESLWPEGLFLPPVQPLLAHHGGHGVRRTELQYLPALEPDNLDPFFHDSTEAIAAIAKFGRRGLYFHEIPHIPSLLANQQLRVDNQLEPHRLGSIRHTWPFYRP